MPEAAEVETVRRGLIFLRGQKLQRLEVVSNKLAAGGEESLVEGKELLAVLRQGKLLAFEFDGIVLTSHLRMTGRWARGEVREKSTRAILHFSQDTVSFLDPRGFATMDLRDPENWRRGLGPDLFSLPKNWTPPERVQRSKRSTKAVLLDQSVVSGIGNYLADESLWTCQISPGRPACENQERDWKGLYRAAQDLAERVLVSGGVSVRDYVDLDGTEGLGAELLQVYGQAGEGCLRCGVELEKTRIAGRGTTYCPSCQRYEEHPEQAS